MKKIYFVLLMAWACVAWGQGFPVKRNATSPVTLERVKALPATQISSDGFTANWQAVDGAEAYCVFVYSRYTAPSAGEYAVMAEDFSGIDDGSVIEPAGGDELYVDLAELGYSDMYGWSAYAYPNYIPSMVAGLVYSPYMDLRHNDGRYKLVVSAYATEGDTIRLESHGTGEKILYKYAAHVPNDHQGISQDTIEFANGSKDTFFSIINVTAEVSQPDYFDAFEVLQDLEEGDVVNVMIASNEAVEAEDDWGNAVTSCRFASLPYKGDATVVWYDIYAVVHDWNTPNGSLPYTAVYSDYSSMVRVDLAGGTSEVEDDLAGVTTIATEVPANGQAYNMMGQPVDDNYRGIVIVNGRKEVRR